MRFILFTFWLIIFTSCQQPLQEESLTDAEKAETIADVRQMLNDYFYDMQNVGLLSEFKYLDSTPDFFWVPPGYESAIDYDSVQAILIKSAPLYRSISYQWDTLRIIPLTKDLVNYTGRINGILIDAAGNSTTLQMLETGIIIKRPDGWKLLSGQSAILSNGVNELH